jgi:hypothetical protein
MGAGQREQTTTMTDVVARLGESLADLTGPTCDRIYAQLDSYAAIEPTALASAVARNLRTALTALREGRVPEPTSLDGAATTARERYESGVPAEEIVRGFRISIALIQEEFLDIASSTRLSVEDTVAGSRIMWGLGDAFSTRIITEYHQLALNAALRDARLRTAAVHRLLAGEGPDASALVPIDAHAPYAAVRCAVANPADVERVRAHLEATGSTPTTRALVAADGGVCLGVVATQPTDPGVAVGIGPFVPPDDLPRSDRVARQALQLATRLGRDGIQGIATLGWRMAAASRPDVWRMYADRFRTPLEAEGEFGAELRDRRPGLAGAPAQRQQGRRRDQRPCQHAALPPAPLCRHHRLRPGGRRRRDGRHLGPRTRPSRPLKHPSTTRCSFVQLHDAERWSSVRSQTPSRSLALRPTPKLEIRTKTFRPASA